MEAVGCDVCGRSCDRATANDEERPQGRMLDQNQSTSAGFGSFASLQDLLKGWRGVCSLRNVMDGISPAPSASQWTAGSGVRPNGKLNASCSHDSFISGLQMETGGLRGLAGGVKTSVVR